MNVESGETMRAAGLKAIATVLESTAVLIKSKHPSNQKLIDKIANRIKGFISKSVSLSVVFTSKPPPFNSFRSHPRSSFAGLLLLIKGPCHLLFHPLRPIPFPLFPSFQPPHPNEQIHLTPNLSPDAQKYVLCQYNVPRSLLAEATRITPGKRAPTVTALEAVDWVAISSMVPRKQVAPVMDALTEIGATDILVLKIENSRTE